VDSLDREEGQNPKILLASKLVVWIIATAISDGHYFCPVMPLPVKGLPLKLNLQRCEVITLTSLFKLKSLLKITFLS
jgi:hypothetical protein